MAISFPYCSPQPFTMSGYPAQDEQRSSLYEYTRVDVTPETYQYFVSNYEGSSHIPPHQESSQPLTSQHGPSGLGVDVHDFSGEGSTHLAPPSSPRRSSTSPPSTVGGSPLFISPLPTTTSSPNVYPQDSSAGDLGHIHHTSEPHNMGHKLSVHKSKMKKKDVQRQINEILSSQNQNISGLANQLNAFLRLYRQQERTIRDLEQRNGKQEVRIQELEAELEVYRLAQAQAQTAATDQFHVMPLRSLSQDYPRNHQL